MSLEPLRFVPTFRQKVWGTTALEPWFPPSRSKIGEVWFGWDDCLTAGGARLHDLIAQHGAALLGTGVAGGGERRFPILSKFIFTSERLSIQVHPGEAYARRNENSPGKTEMWYILRAAPGATVAMGFREPVTRQRLREAAVSGEIESLLDWKPVQPGDAYYIPAGTVHAIGAGIALCEIQTTSDVTYRLYDYGRPRKLHLDKAVETAELGPHPGRSAPTELPGGGTLLASGRFFAVERLSFVEPYDYRPDAERFHLLLVLSGQGSLGGRYISPGEAWLIPATADPFSLAPSGKIELLRAYVPRS